jgi:hypothetical protein
MSDKRLHPREPANYRVSLIHETFGEVTTCMKDMSNGGICIRLPDTTLPAVGESIQMQLLDTDVTAKPTTLQIVWIVEDAMGLRFIED